MKLQLASFAKHMCLLGVLAYLAPNAIAQAADHAQEESSSVKEIADQPSFYLWPIDAWEKWNGNEEEYKALEKDVDMALQKTKQPEELVKQLKLAAGQSRKDSKAQFKWGYAAYKLYLSKKPADKSLLNGVSWRLGLLPADTYRYARLQFLVEATKYPQRDVIKFGRILAKQNPQDAEVKYQLLSLLDPSESTKEMTESLALAKELIDLDPKRPSAHAAYAGVYWVIWEMTEKRSDAEIAIQSYKKFLELAPPDHEFRGQAERLISFIEKRLSAQ